MRTPISNLHSSDGWKVTLTLSNHSTSELVLYHPLLWQTWFTWSESSWAIFPLFIKRMDFMSFPFFTDWIYCHSTSFSSTFLLSSFTKNQVTACALLDAWRALLQIWTASHLLSGMHWFWAGVTIRNGKATAVFSPNLPKTFCLFSDGLQPLSADSFTQKDTETMLARRLSKGLLNR